MNAFSSSKYVRGSRAQQTIIAWGILTAAIGLTAGIRAEPQAAAARDPSAPSTRTSPSTAPAPDDNPYDDASARPTSRKVPAARQSKAKRPNRGDGDREHRATAPPRSPDDGLSSLHQKMTDLAAKVKELTDLVGARPAVVAQGQGSPTEEPKPAQNTETFSEAVRDYVRERVHTISASFSAPEKPSALFIEPDSAELKRLLEPVEQALASRGTPKELDRVHLRALVYLRMLEARAKLTSPETMPALNKLFRELHLDPASLAEHVRRTLLPASFPANPDLTVVLGAAATAHPEPQNARDFLAWAARLVSQDLGGILSARGERPYRSDAESQLEAAAEDALKDGSDVLKLQVELQRLLAEMKTLKANGARQASTENWHYRLLQAERKLDQLHLAVESQHEALTTLARRSPVRAAPTPVSEPVIEPPAAEPTAEGLTSQH